MKTELYFKSYTEAIDAALKSVTGKFAVNSDETFQLIGVLSKRPGEGKTTSVKIPLYKKEDKEYTKAVNYLAIQVYNRGNNQEKPFELNSYKTK